MSGEDGMSDRLRRYLLEKANYTCEIPGCELISLILILIYPFFRYIILMEMQLIIKKKISRFCAQIIMQ
jgi:hypothetical protein